MHLIPSENFAITNPRDTVEIHLPDGRVVSGPRSAPVGDFLFASNQENTPPLICAIVNGELRELTYPIKIDAKVQPITMAEPDGMRVYRRSLVFLAETAFDQLFPDGVLTVDHSVGSGGYYCHVSKCGPLSPATLDQLEGLMRHLVELDLPFERQIVPLNEAMEIFQSEGEDDQVNLILHRQKPYLTLYKLQDHRDYHHGYMVPSTGYLRWFKLTPAGEGFTLRFPRSQAPTEILPLSDYPKLLSTFRQYGDWLNRLGISSVGALDNAIKNDRIKEIILVSEALHEQRVSEIAAQIAEHREYVRVVLISGPTSSGKTTFSKRLAIQLLAHGISPCPLEMDNYFLDRDATPPGEDGKPDFESINALDRARLSNDLMQLIEGKTVTIPHFDFIQGKRLGGEEVRLTPDQIVILEGIHGLNPELLITLPSQKAFRIYVSALTQLNLDRHNRVSTTDTRLIRRIVRDARERGYPAQQTIQRWESVRKGEKQYIFPFQENADALFNSALVYEMSALKPIAEPLLRQVPYGTSEYVEAKRLLAFLEWFLPIDSELIPDNSILREFIGDSILRNFALWHNHQI